MAEYIDRAAAVKVILRERKPTNSVAQNRMLSIIQRDLLTMCAADVAPWWDISFPSDCQTVIRSSVWLSSDALWRGIWTMGGLWRSTGYAQTGHTMLAPCFMLRHGGQHDDFCSYGERKEGETDGS